VLVVAARARLGCGEPTGARDALRHARTIDPGRPDLLRLEAGIAAELGDLDGAVSACQAALELDPAVAQTWLDLGGFQERREKWVQARAAYERALDLVPTFVEAALARADLVRRVESPGAAVNLLVDLLLSDPYDLRALLLLGRSLLDEGRPGRALEALDRLLKFDPDDDAALFHRGIALARLRRYREAVRAWEAVVHCDPAGIFAQAARMHARSARDLAHIFAGAA
jgi:tetratricopeptide (TPR) repeat protein